MSNSVSAGDEFGSVKAVGAGPRYSAGWFETSCPKKNMPSKKHDITWGGARRVQSSRLEDWSKAKLQGYWHWTQASWM